MEIDGDGGAVYVPSPTPSAPPAAPPEAPPEAEPVVDVPSQPAPVATATGGVYNQTVGLTSGDDFVLPPEDDPDTYRENHTGEVNTDYPPETGAQGRGQEPVVTQPAAPRVVTKGPDNTTIITEGDKRITVFEDGTQMEETIGSAYYDRNYTTTNNGTTNTSQYVRVGAPDDNNRIETDTEIQTTGSVTTTRRATTTYVDQPIASQDPNFGYTADRYGIQGAQQTGPTQKTHTQAFTVDQANLDNPYSVQEDTTTYSATFDNPGLPSDVDPMDFGDLVIGRPEQRKLQVSSTQGTVYPDQGQPVKVNTSSSVLTYTLTDQLGNKVQAYEDVTINAAANTSKITQGFTGNTPGQVGLHTPVHMNPEFDKMWMESGPPYNFQRSASYNGVFAGQAVDTTFKYGNFDDPLRVGKTLIIQSDGPFRGTDLVNNTDQHVTWTASDYEPIETTDGPGHRRTTQSSVAGSGVSQIDVDDDFLSGVKVGSSDVLQYDLNDPKKAPKNLYHEDRSVRLYSAADINPEWLAGLDPEERDLFLAQLNNGPVRINLRNADNKVTGASFNSFSGLDPVSGAQLNYLLEGDGDHGQSRRSSLILPQPDGSVKLLGPGAGYTIRPDGSIVDKNGLAISDLGDGSANVARFLLGVGDMKVQASSFKPSWGEFDGFKSRAVGGSGSALDFGFGIWKTIDAARNGNKSGVLWGAAQTAQGGGDLLASVTEAGSAGRFLAAHLTVPGRLLLAAKGGGDIILGVRHGDTRQVLEGGFGILNAVPNPWAAGISFLGGLAITYDKTLDPKRNATYRIPPFQVK